MGTNELRKRDTWQDYSGENAGKAERNFYDVFLAEFSNTNFSVEANPQDFNRIYVDVALSGKILTEIYAPNTL